MAVNLVPFPRLHFFLSGVAPLTDDKSARYSQWSVPQLYQQLWDGKNLMSAVDHKMGKYLSAAITFRSAKISAAEVEQQSVAIRQRNSAYFVPWIPHNIMTSLCSVPAKNYPNSAVMIGNNSAITSVINRITDQFSAMFRRKAFLHRYLEHGKICPGRYD
jgi:tubulin beta